MRFNGDRRAFVCAVARRCVSLGGLLGVAARGRGAAARQSGGSSAEQLVAAMQDGGKVVYLRYPTTGGLDVARELGRALYALRVPLNDIVAAPVLQARRTAEAAFGTDRLRVAAELADAETTGDAVQMVRRLLRTTPGPGMNRVLVGDRSRLEQGTERRFPDPILPDGAMAVFLPGQAPQLLGTITAERVITSAKARGAM